MKLYKKLKFKDNKLSKKKFYEIIFEKKGEKDWFHKFFMSIPEWKVKVLKKNNLGDKIKSYYKGTLINNKPHGKGKEIILSPSGYLAEVISFYDGEWKNGKKNGNGLWYNHHPSLGLTKSLDALNPYHIANFGNINQEIYYNGKWKDNKKNGKGYYEFQKGLFEGDFKNDKMFNGFLKYWNCEFIFQKNIKKQSNLKIEIIKGKEIKNKEIMDYEKNNSQWYM